MINFAYWSYGLTGKGKIGRNGKEIKRSASWLQHRSICTLGIFFFGCYVCFPWENTQVTPVIVRVNGYGF